MVLFLLAMLRGGRPESVRLEHRLLCYDPGESPPNPWGRKTWWGGYAAPTEEPVDIGRSDVRRIALERIGGRERLYLDHGAERIEIGAALREAERYWLFAVLWRWHVPDQPLPPIERGDGQPEWVPSFPVVLIASTVAAVFVMCAGLCVLSALIG